MERKSFRQGSGNGSSEALYLDKKVEVNLLQLPERSQQSPLACNRSHLPALLVTGRTFTVVTLSQPHVLMQKHQEEWRSSVCMVQDVQFQMLAQEPLW